MGLNVLRAMWHDPGFICNILQHNWSFVIYERPILGDSPKPHFVAKYGFQMKSAGFHKICHISHEIHPIS